MIIFVQHLQEISYILDKESNKKKRNTPVKDNFCKNLFQTPKSNQNEGNDFANMKFKWKYVVLQGKKYPILTEVILYWSIPLLFVGFLIKYVS
jgi:hypothetical protein